MERDGLSFRVQFCLSMQRALWGLVPACLRAVALGFEGEVARARFIFDHEPDADDREAVSEVETYVFADFGPGLLTEFTVDVVPDGPLTHKPREAWWAYIRQEPRSSEG